MGRKHRVAKANLRANQQTARAIVAQNKILKKQAKFPPAYPAMAAPAPAPQQQKVALPAGIALSPDGQHVLVQNEWKPFAHNHLGAFWFNGQGWVTLSDGISSQARTGDAAHAAQVNAIANPETAQALQNLHNLLYTRIITQAEYDAAKARLLGG